MARRCGFLTALWLAAMAAVVSADCVCSGLDYTNGGSYLVDGSSDKPFVFTSQFQGWYPERVVGRVS